MSSLSYSSSPLLLAIEQNAQNYPDKCIFIDINTQVTWKEALQISKYILPFLR